MMGKLKRKVTVKNEERDKDTVKKNRRKKIQKKIRKRKRIVKAETTPKKKRGRPKGSVTIKGKKKPNLKPIKIKKYKKQRCAYVNPETGKPCRNNAVGKSTLCKKHGGNPIVKENLLPAQHTKFLVQDVNTKFDPSIHPLAFIELSRGGMGETEIAAEFEVAVSTIHGWSERYESFATAYEIGKALHESWWMLQGKTALRDRYFNTSLFKFLTGNVLGWSEKQETKNLNVNAHGVLCVPDSKSVDEWEQENIQDAEYTETVEAE